MIKLGTNILSQTVQRNLGRATQDLSSASERLSSGQRINKAADDAAGLAISMSLNADSWIFSQGIRNLNDGLSAVSIADSAIGELSNITQRIEELAAQSMNGTFSASQRGSMQKEVTALQAEWNRIVESTTFNNTNLLTGDNTRFVLQGGKSVEGTLALQVGEGQRGGTTRVSTDSQGGQGNGSSTAYAISADGQFIAFNSAASNLVSGDANGVTDTFIKNTRTGIVTIVSTDSQGNQGNFNSHARAVSADGRYVVFDSGATNLVSGDTNGQQDIFLKDTVTGVTKRISTDSQGNQGNGGGAFSAVISADGRYVGFSSSATDLVSGDTNGASDAFIKDTLTGITTRISADGQGSQGNGASYISAISADGRYVVFNSAASNLVSGDTNANMDVFLKDTFTGVTTRVSTDSQGNQGNLSSNLSTISADGRYVGFTSLSTNLVSGDTNVASDVFVKDALTGVTMRISTDSQGVQGNGFSHVRAISADGRYVAFNSSATNLVPGDTNGWDDAFIKDTFTGITTRISTTSQGDQAIGGGRVYGLSADGRYAVFNSSASTLVAGDTNGQGDVFLKDLTQLGVQQMAGMVVSDRVSAGITLSLVQRYREELLSYRANIGASTSRISTFINTLQVGAENFKAAESRIVDVDVAQESANAVRTRILQQTGASLLAQANQEPQISLSLLRNI